MQTKKIHQYFLTVILHTRHTVMNTNLKSEKSIKEYLKTISDDDVIKYYLDIEFCPFPILILEEYTRRFKQKSKPEIIRKLKRQTEFAQKKVRRSHSFAKRQKPLDEITVEKSEEFLKEAKKRGYEASGTIIKKSKNLGSKIKKVTSNGAKKGIKASKYLRTSSSSSSAKNLEILEKLGKLRKAGIITEKEFQEKKRKVLSKI